ncbi:cytochrome P450 4c21-like [Planococcus citri]|uniref:cytochrome P450 4c21-like n=1 Tax=Planococcus citri TaxID=170843 RepID=UPI0031F92AC9
MNIIQVFLCLIVLAILAKFIHKKKYKRLYELLEQFPSYPTYPLIGNAHLLIGSTEGVLGRLEKIMQPYDRVIYWIGHTPILFLKKHDDIAVVLNQSQDRDILEATDEWLGIGLLNARYKEWLKSRKMLAPAFSSHMLSKYMTVFNKNASSLVENLKPVAEMGEQIDVLDWVMNVNLDGITENAMGISIQLCGKMGKEFCEAMIEGLKHGVKRFQWPWLLSYHIYMIYLRISGKIKCIDHLQCLPTKILQENIENNIQDFQANTSKSVVDLLIKSSVTDSSFNEIRMRDELLHIISAGVETTALSLSFLMLMLAMNQNIQQKVYEEITQFVADDEMLNETHLNNFRYLEQCIQETLRMFSPVMLTSRRTHKEIILKDNKIIPANTLVVTFIHFSNYDADLYENPFKWDPEHFSDQAVQQRPKTGQLTFGYGARSCIGK